MRRKTYNRILSTLRIICVSLFVAGILYLYFGTDVFLIRSFTYSGVSNDDAKKLDASLTPLLEGKRLLFFPNDKLLTYPKKQMEIAVRKALPNTDTLSIHASGLHTLSVSIVPYEPIFRTNEGNGVDKRGIIYREQNDISNLPLLTMATSTKGAFLAGLAQFIDKVNTVLFTVNRIEINNDHDVHLYPISGGSTVILSGDADFAKEWSTLVSALDTDPLKSLLASKKNDLEYIDLRFGNKVFYKFTNTNPQDIISPHATSTQAPSH